jgi:hypothetical protein
MVVFKSLKFWTLVAGLLLFVIQSYYPAFPLTEDVLLKVVIFALGLAGIHPELKARGLI